MAKPLQRQTVEEIGRGCRDESRRDRAAEQGYCYELFRRALQKQDQSAWNAIDQQYRPLVRSWLRQALPDGSHDDLEEMAQETLHKFWRTLTPRARHLHDHFEHVGALLRYLNKCAVTTVLDRRRREQKQLRLITAMQTAGDEMALAPATQETAWEQQEMIQRVQVWIQQHVTDPQELTVLRLSFEQGLTPADIARHCPDDFQDVNQVRRVKERVLLRARRALA